jgi:hypothetical protein
MDNATVGPSRLILFGSRLKKINDFLGCLFIPLGRNPIGICIAEAVVMYLLKFILLEEYDRWGNSARTVLELVLV